MKLLTSVAIVAMVASAVAQSPSTAQNVKNQLSGGKPAAAAPAPRPATQGAKPAAAPAKSVTSTAKPAAAKTGRVAAKPLPQTTVSVTPQKTAKASSATKPKAKAAVKPATKQANADAAPEMKKSTVAVAARRDPFLSPVVERGLGRSGCSGGKKCLVPDQLRLQGIVTSGNGHIAVVVNGENRAYFLHENDPIYNGVVTKINENSVTFREQVKDVLGKPATREVVKKINTPA